MENSNLPVKNHRGFFSKITQAIKSLFFKRDKSHKDTQSNTNQSSKDNIYETFIESLQEKSDIEAAYKKDTLKYIVETVEQDASTLENLTVEQLEDVNDYYTEQIEEVDKQIRKTKLKYNL